MRHFAMKHFAMKRLIAVFALALCATAAAQAAPRAGAYPTMHNEQEAPRPPGVNIAGARPGQVVLYCTTLSAGCKGMRAHLAKRGIDYLDKELTTDTVAQAEFDALGGLGVPLMVFKDRLLHGYYPTSFERVHAQQAAGQPAPRAANAGAGQRGASAGGKPGAATAADAPVPSAAGLASPVERIKPASIAAYLQAQPEVVVQFTSPDEHCRYCVESYPGFDAAARAYGRAARFVRVEWTPWNAFPEAVSGFGFGGVPAQIAYRSGKEIARFDGSLMNRSDAFGAFVKQAYALDKAFPASPVAVDEVLFENLPAYLMRNPRAAVQFTSPDPNCQPCAASHALFEDIAARRRGNIAFARVQWMPWQSVPAGSTVNYKLRVVPEIKAFHDGRLTDTLAGITRPRLEAWLGRQFGISP